MASAAGEDDLYWEWVAKCSKWAVAAQGSFICTPGGTMCSGPLCAYLATAPLSCPRPTCSQVWEPINGYCEFLNICLCFNGYKGQNCSEIISHPFCKNGVAESAEGPCICDEGWHGDLCNVPVCADGCNSKHGFCIEPNQCQCRLGWEGSDCDTCSPYPGCQNGGCTRPWECSCEQGWTGIYCNETGITSTTTITTTPTTTTTTTTAECGPDDVSVVWGDAYSYKFRVQHILTLENPELYGKNYWIAPDNKKAKFVLNLACSKSFTSIQLVNTHSSHEKDRSTRQFKLYTSHSEEGPWTQVLDTELEDSRQQTDPLPVQTIGLDTGRVTAQFVKFELVSWWGASGGLQYFHIADN